jgi:hypothetical protein
MDAQLIEKLDRRRYQGLLLMAISFSLGYLGVISAKLPDEWMVPGWIFPVFTLLGVILFIIGFRRDRIVRKEIKKEPELKDALDNELFKLYRYKSWRWSSLAYSTSSLVFCQIARRIPTLTVDGVCFTILFIGAITWLVSLLIYLKR